MKWLYPAGLLASIFLGGCNSEDNVDKQSTTSAPVNESVAAPPPPPGPAKVHFEGIWQGTVTPDSPGSSLPALLIVNGWGEFRLLTDDRQFVGFPLRTTSLVEGDLSGLRSGSSTWSDGNRVSRFSLDGSIDDSEFIDARYSGNVESGAIALAWAALDSDTRIGSIHGIWVLHDEDQNIQATMQLDAFNLWEARISGSHSNGCVYSGLVEAWTSYYSYDVVPFEVSGCPLVAGTDINGTFSGTAALINVDGSDSGKPQLVMILSNDSVQISFFMSAVST